MEAIASADTTALKAHNVKTTASSSSSGSNWEVYADNYFDGEFEAPFSESEEEEEEEEEIEEEEEYEVNTKTVLMDRSPEVESVNSSAQEVSPQAHKPSESNLLLSQDGTTELPSLAIIGTAVFIRLNWIIKSVINLIALIIFLVIICSYQACLFDNCDKSVYGICRPCVQYVELKVFAALTLVSLFLATVLLGRSNDLNFRMSFLWTEKTQQETEQKRILEEVNQLLLQNILPEHVVKHYIDYDTQELYSELHQNVCVMFASIPNFWDFYKEDDITWDKTDTDNEGGKECLRLLNEIIADFDELLQKPKYGRIEKIKTIGSTYMAACGLTMGLGDPKENIVTLAKFAFEIQRKLKEINRHSFNEFQLRIGLNHGTVVAGVIGASKPQYDIWGNTVNVASRMDSTGVAGKIQVTDDTATVLRDNDFQLEKRGKITVKGKGMLTTHFLVGDPKNGGI